MKEFITEMEEAYDVKLPKRYKDFLTKKEFEKHSSIEFDGYISGEYELDFTDELLSDVAELGINAGISDMDDVDWAGDYGDYVPLASISHPDVDEPKGFLVLDIKTKDNPVLFFEQDGWMLFPIAKSFDAFLKALPLAKNNIKKAFTPGE